MCQDVSNNKIAGIAEISAAPGIRIINLDDNCVSDLAGLSDVAALRALSAKNNKITTTAGLPPNLRTANLEGNPVAELAGLEGLASLKALQLHGGKLTTLAGLGAPALETLCVEENLIATTEGIEGAPLLAKVEARGNKIASLAGFSETHEQLAFLDLRDNEISVFEELASLATLPKLSVLKLSGNPICKLPCYKPRVIALLSVTELDEEDVTQEEVQEAKIWWKEEEARLAAEAEAAAE